jgi:hypothetical protein
MVLLLLLLRVSQQQEEMVLLLLLLRVSQQPEEMVLLLRGDFSMVTLLMGADAVRNKQRKIKHQHKRMKIPRGE